MDKSGKEVLAGEVALRAVIEDDFPFFYQHQLDPDANYMAAFTVKDPSDRDAFTAHWTKILKDAAISKQTILYGGQVAGSVSKFELFGQPAVSYWLGKEFWGKGIATKALSLFLKQVETRPLYARAAKDNSASIRVLQKCGFVISGEDKGFSNARGTDVEEYILTLD